MVHADSQASWYLPPKLYEKADSHFVTSALTDLVLKKFLVLTERDCLCPITPLPFIINTEKEADEHTLQYRPKYLTRLLNCSSISKYVRFFVCFALLAQSCYATRTGLNLCPPAASSPSAEVSSSATPGLPSLLLKLQLETLQILYTPIPMLILQKSLNPACLKKGSRGLLWGLTL